MLLRRYHQVDEVKPEAKVEVKQPEPNEVPVKKAKQKKIGGDKDVRSKDS